MIRGNVIQRYIYSVKELIHCKHSVLNGIHAMYYMLCLVCFSFTCVNSVYAKDLSFKKVDIDLSDNGVRAIIEDYRGYMWFGTEGGLNRFDGVNVYNYSYVPGDANSLSDNSVVKLYESIHNDLWVCTNNGLNRYNRDKDNFERFFYNKETDTDYYFVQQVVEDSEGVIWLATSGGVCVLDSSLGTYSNFWDYTKQTDKLSQSVNCLLSYDDRLLGGTGDGRLVNFNKHTGEIESFLFDNGDANQVKPIVITSLTIHSNGLLWGTTSEGGLIQIEEVRNGHIWYKQYMHNSGGTNSISYNYLSTICEFSNTEILIGTENGGLNKFNFKNETFAHYQKGDKVNSGIGGNSIWSLYRDSKGYIWVGVFNFGLNILDNKIAKFKSYKNLPHDSQSLTHSSITSFVEDEKGNVWITSDGGGMDYWVRDRNLFHHYKAKDGSGTISSNAGLCLYLSKEGEIWSGYYIGGISIYNPETKRFRYLNTSNGLSSNNVFSIAERANGKIYIGNFGGGLDIYNPKDGSVETIAINTLDKKVMRDIHVNTLFVDNSDHLWMGFNNGGLALLRELQDGSIDFVRYEHEPENKASISNNNVLCINEDSHGNLWVGTRDGLNKFDRVSNKFEVFKVEHGLPSNAVVGVLEDDNGHLWISTLHGLSQFDIANQHFKNYTIADGIQGMKFSNRSAVYKSKRGEMFFGGNDGFTVFNPAGIQYAEGFPKVYISDLKLFNKPIRIGAKGSPLSTQIAEATEIELNNKQSVFTIEYVALEYLTSDKIHYAYRLKGLEEDWNYVASRRSATYTNLDAGDYEFMVRSTNAEGDWNAEYTSLKITMQPPWWETWGFRFFVLIALATLLYVVYRWRVYSMKIQQDILLKMVDERTKELNESNHELGMVNSEVFQQKEELLTQSDALVKTNSSLELSRNELEKHKGNLEYLVQVRTEELNKAKEKAEESDRLKTAFLENMSHEIRTPMNAIVGFSNLLKQSALNENLKQNYISQINSNTHSLLMLIDDILDLSMMESNTIKVQEKEFGLNALLDEVFEGGAVIGNGLIKTLNHKLKNQHLIINSDRYRIKQILINLFSNAFKFTEQGCIELGCDIVEDSLILYVKDSGIGISAENLNVIFNRFRKADTSKAKLFRGAGLGLTISKRVATLLGGQLSVESELNVGSCFTLELPIETVVRGRQSSFDVNDASNYNWTGKNILIVEDEQTNYTYLKSAMTETNANIFWAQDGSIAVSMFKTGEKYDVVLMDIKMPSMDGFTATAIIKELLPDQIIIAQTAYASGEDRVRIDHSGFDDCLIKPILPEDLFSVLSKFIR